MLFVLVVHDVEVGRYVLPIVAAACVVGAACAASRLALFVPALAAALFAVACVVVPAHAASRPLEALVGDALGSHVPSSLIIARQEPLLVLPRGVRPILATPATVVAVERAAKLRGETLTTSLALRELGATAEGWNEIEQFHATADVTDQGLRDLALLSR